MIVSESYDWSQFHVQMYYPAPVDDVFNRWATPKGLASFFLEEAVHRSQGGSVRGPEEMAQTGDAYEWSYLHHFKHGGTFTQVVENELLAFTFGSMAVSIRFSEHEGATLVDLHQTGCSTEDPQRAWDHVNCRSCWIYFMTNLRSVLQGSPDLRDRAHPLWNDSISIGFSAPD